LPARTRAASAPPPETAKLNGVDPEARLMDVLQRIAAGDPANRISELMP
jgi:hypothetical protein